MTYATGTVLRITKLVNDAGIEISDDAWGIILDDEDMMVFRKLLKDPYSHRSADGWCSQVCPVSWANEGAAEAVADEVPDDMPKDFWPLAARLTLGDGGGA